MDDGRRAARWLMIVAVVAWAAVALPLVLGQRTLYQRDVLSVHAPWKVFGAQALRHGSVPAFNPGWGLGQPFRGNPNALPLYPGNLLYLALPFWIAFNLHFALHWLLALVAFRALARALGMDELAAALAAITFAGSGYVLSCLTFYNLIAVVAWWPLAMWGAVVGGRRGVAWGGLACGMALYAGEPITVALAALPLFIASCERHGFRRALGVAAAIGALGLVVALPQVVAALRISEFTFRGGHGALPSQAASFTLHPLRLVELLLPLPFGSPSRIGVGSWWATRLSSPPPLFYSLYAGCVGLWLALRARQRRPWLWLGGTGLALAWLLGLSGTLLVEWTGGLFRYPEKLLVWPAIALPLLAGWGLAALTKEARPGRGVILVAAGAALMAVVVAAVRPWWLARARSLPGASASTALGLERLFTQWSVALGLAALLLAAAVWCARRGRRSMVAALQVAALLQLYPLTTTAPAEPLRTPIAWAKAIPERAEIANAAMTHPRWQEVTFTLGDRPSWARTAVERQLLAPWSGAPLGYGYPLAPDVEGTQSPLHSLVLFNLPKLDLEQRLRWLRVLGVERLVLYEEPGITGLRLLTSSTWAGTESRLYAVENPQPKVSWPPRVEAAASPVEVLKRVSFGSDDPLTLAVVPEAVDHHAGGTVELLRETADRLELRSHGPGGLVIVRRAYQPLYRARADGQALRTLPVDLVLLGVVVPPGDVKVVIDVSSTPETAAGILAGLVALGAVAIAWRSRGD